MSGRAGQLAFSLLAACSSSLVEKASLVKFGTEGSGVAPKSGCELGDEDGFIVGGPPWLQKVTRRNE